MTGPLVVAIDGPAASGKSTLAAAAGRRAAASRSSTPASSTARSAAACCEAGADPADAKEARPPPRRSRPSEVDAARLRGEEIGQAASKVAAFPAVREALLPFQRRFAARRRGAVLAGRDIGTVVLPRRGREAVRHRQPWRSAPGGGRTSCAAAAAGLYTRDILAELRERDRRDRERAVAPLRAAPDAFVLDTTRLEPEATFEAALRHVEQALAAAGAASTAAGEQEPLARRDGCPVPFGALMTETAVPRSPAVARRLRGDARRAVRPEQPPRRHASSRARVVVDRQRRGGRRRRPEVRRTRPAQGVRRPRPAARGQASATASTSTSSGSRTAAARRSCRATRRGARRAGTASRSAFNEQTKVEGAHLRPRQGRLHRRPRRRRGLPAGLARSTSGRCATSAR